MTTTVIAALIAAFGGIAVAGATYWFTKQRERDAEWRREKLEHYKVFVVALSGTISGESTAEGQRAFARACNNLNLVAPQAVIEALREFQQEIKISNPSKSMERHDRLMATLFYEIRRDLKISPSDDPQAFRVGLWASGVKANDPPVPPNQTHNTPELYDSIANGAKEVRLLSALQYGALWEAYITMARLLSSLIPQGAEDPVSVPRSASQRISLSANLLQSLTIVEDAISCGFYWAASALLRQHMEALARIIQIRGGKPATDTRPPNVRVLPFNLGQNYGRLSELAHVSSGELLRDFALSSSGEEVATYVPTFREDWSRKLLAVHIEHMVVLAIEIDLLHRELYPKKSLVDLGETLQHVAKIFIQEGYWKELEKQG
jgi:hypothetical protein